MAATFIKDKITLTQPRAADLEKKMSSIEVDRPELSATAEETNARLGKRSIPHPSTDRFAEARKAKKKANRVRHRARLKRSNSNG
jgi:hypothetical protein